MVRTRFLALDGKIFRLTKGITVPGAKIVEGKIIPSSIEAAVIADQPGEAYNIGPVSRFSIPGLKGTPKYEAFYAESKADINAISFIRTPPGPGKHYMRFSYAGGTVTIGESP